MVNILSIISKGLHVLMQPVATSTVATCYLFTPCSRHIAPSPSHWRMEMGTRSRIMDYIDIGIEAFTLYVT